MMNLTKRSTKAINTHMLTIEWAISKKLSILTTKSDFSAEFESIRTVVTSRMMKMV